MSTRFYLPRSGSPAATPAVAAEWGVSGAQQARRISTAKGSDVAAADDTASFRESSASTISVVHYQGVSDELAPQTISGTFSAAFRGAVESGALAHMQIVVRVVSNDGSTVRGTLYAGYTGARGDSSTGTGISRGLTTSTSIRIASAEALSSVTAEAGDRIVVEIGQRFTNTITTPVGGYWYFGDSGTDTSTAEGTNEASTIPWVELSADVVFGSVARPSVISASSAVFTPASSTSVDGTAGASVIAATTAIGSLSFGEPTRYYFPRTGSPAVTPANGSVWDVTANRQARPISTVKGADTAASDTSASFEETSASAQNVLHYLGVSGPLAAQTIRGSFNAAFRGGVSSALSDAHLQIVIRVVSNDGATQRGVLYSGYTGALSGSGIGREFTTATLIMAAFDEPLTQLDVLDGDRLVIEVGQRFTNTVTTAYNGYLTFGDSSAQADTSQAEGTNETSTVPWVEFTGGIVPQSGPGYAVVSVIAAAVSIGTGVSSDAAVTADAVAATTAIGPAGFFLPAVPRPRRVTRVAGWRADRL